MTEKCSFVYDRKTHGRERGGRCDAQVYRDGFCENHLYGVNRKRRKPSESVEEHATVGEWQMPPTRLGDLCKRIDMLNAKVDLIVGRLNVPLSSADRESTKKACEEARAQGLSGQAMVDAIQRHALEQLLLQPLASKVWRALNPRYPLLSQEQIEIFELIHAHAFQTNL